MLCAVVACSVCFAVVHYQRRYAERSSRERATRLFKTTLDVLGVFPEAFRVGFADLETWVLRSDVPFETLAKFFTKDGAKAHDRNELLGPYKENGRY